MPEGLVFAAVAPHGVHAVPEAETGIGHDTQRAMAELGRRWEAARADATVVLTPHNVHVEGHFAVLLGASASGSLAEWGAPRVELDVRLDAALARRCVEALRAEGLPAVSVSYGGNDETLAALPLDWGSLVPLWFMRGPAVVVSPAHDPDGPYGFDPASAAYDARVVELVREDRLAELLDLDPAFVAAASADSWWQLLMLHGALANGWRAELLSYEAPTYFGMLCAAYERR